MFRPCNKAFNVATTKKSFLKNVTMRCFMARLNYYRTLRRKGRVHNVVVRYFKNVVHLKNAFLKQFNVKKSDVIAL